MGEATFICVRTVARERVRYDRAGVLADLAEAAIADADLRRVELLDDPFVHLTDDQANGLPPDTVLGVVIARASTNGHML